MLPAAALVSSAVFETVSLLRSSSRTLTDFWFSDLMLASVGCTESMMSTEGMALKVAKVERRVEDDLDCVGMGE